MAAAADWSMIVLDSTAIAAGELEKIRAEFARFFLLRDPGAGTAVFTRRGKAGGCEVYFSPECDAYAEFIFERHAAEKSRAPALLGTTLLVGYPAAVGSLLGKGSRVESLAAVASRQPQTTQGAVERASFLRRKKTAG
jgi:hypothetical protein